MLFSTSRSKMAVASDLPVELVTRPLSLVALSGLDISANTAHKKIWESFTLNRQPDRISLAFTPVPYDHQFPKCKQKVGKESLSWLFLLYIVRFVLFLVCTFVLVINLTALWWRCQDGEGDVLVIWLYIPVG